MADFADFRILGQDEFEATAIFSNRQICYEQAVATFLCRSNPQLTAFHLIFIDFHTLYASILRSRRRHVFRIACASTFLAVLFTSGCSVPQASIALPGDSTFLRDQLIVHSDFYIPKKHRLIDELTLRRQDISDQLKLPVSDEPINVYIFEEEQQYRRFMQKTHPDFPDRRAFFVKNDTTLKILAYWGESVGVDLRHEVTHGYLHSVVPNMPLWLDEGLAEYYETPRGTHGVNANHIYLLNVSFLDDSWQPNLPALEVLDQPEQMTQLQYAESWLWVHFLLESDNGDAKLIQDQLARLRMSAESAPLSKFVDQDMQRLNVKVVQHLKELAEKL